jgi:lauroyl/myristoyl acyltransferase
MRHRLEYLVVRALIAAVRLLSVRAVAGAGRAVGFLSYLFDRSHRRIAEGNVAAAFPTRTNTSAAFCSKCSSSAP